MLMITLASFVVIASSLSNQCCQVRQQPMKLLPANLAIKLTAKGLTSPGACHKMPKRLVEKSDGYLTMNKTTYALSAITFMLAASACTSSKSSIDAAMLLEERCGACHSTSIPKNARKTARDWDETVTRMIAKGAKLSAEEKKALLRFLSKRYKP